MTEHPLPIAPLGFVPQSIVWIRLVLLGVLLTTALPFIGVLALIMPQKPTRTRQWVFGWLYKAAGIRLRIQGNPSQNPTLFVSNHTSYLDIILLGHLLRGRFVSKQEVKHWPIIGWVAACTGTLFISRKPQRASFFFQKPHPQQGLLSSHLKVLFLTFSLVKERHLRVFSRSLWFMEPSMAFPWEGFCAISTDGPQRCP